MCEFSKYSSLNVYGLVTLVKCNSAYLFRLDTCNEKIGPPPKTVPLDQFWQPKLVPLANFGPPIKM